MEESDHNGIAQDEERFKSCEPLAVKCAVCHEINVVAPVAAVNTKSAAVPASSKEKEKEKVPGL